MRIKKIKLYKFEELSDDTKEKVREWWRSGGLDYEWWDFVYEDFQTILDIFGFTPGISKGTNSIPAIYFSGFSSQGDGASFEADYEYKKGMLQKIKEYAPIDEELHRIARDLQDLQRRNFYQLAGYITTSGRSAHEYSMQISLDRNDYKEPTADAEYGLLELARDLARWLYKTLEKEYDYLNSDEYIDETIIANEYEFTEDGKPA